MKNLLIIQKIKIKSWAIIIKNIAFDNNLTFITKIKTIKGIFTFLIYQNYTLTIIIIHLLSYFLIIINQIDTIHLLQTFFPQKIVSCQLQEIMLTYNNQAQLELKPTYSPYHPSYNTKPYEHSNYYVPEWLRWQPIKWSDTIVDEIRQLPLIEKVKNYAQIEANSILLKKKQEFFLNLQLNDTQGYAKQLFTATDSLWTSPLDDEAINRIRVVLSPTQVEIPEMRRLNSLCQEIVNQNAARIDLEMAKFKDSFSTSGFTDVTHRPIVSTKLSPSIDTLDKVTRLYLDSSIDKHLNICPPTDRVTIENHHIIYK